MTADDQARSTSINGSLRSQVMSRFFGANAVEFIGLRKGEAARRRLDAFYRQNKIAAPAWVQKVDAA